MFLFCFVLFQLTLIWAWTGRYWRINHRKDVSEQSCFSLAEKCAGKLIRLSWCFMWCSYMDWFECEWTCGVTKRAVCAWSFSPFLHILLIKNLKKLTIKFFHLETCFFYSYKWSLISQFPPSFISIPAALKMLRTEVIVNPFATSLSTTAAYSFSTSSHNVSVVLICMHIRQLSVHIKTWHLIIFVRLLPHGLVGPKYSFRIRHMSL